MGMKRKIIFVVSTGLMVLLFQNCGREQMAFVDSVVDESLEHFSYSYKSATEVYFNVNVIPQEPSGGLKEFLVVGGIAPSDSDSNAQISWEIRMLDESGRDICPMMEGDNQNGETLVEGSCVTQTTNKAHRLESRVYFDGREYSFTQNLNGL